MYKAGDLVFYGGKGVCRITDIARRSAPGAERARMYYILKPLYIDCVVWAPLDLAQRTMRPLVTREEANRLIDRIPEIRAEAYHSKVMRELSDHYQTRLKAYDCAEMIELTMSIYVKKQFAEAQKRKFGYIDEKFLKRAEDLLFGELGAVLGIPKDAVADYISERLARQG